MNLASFFSDPALLIRHWISAVGIFPTYLLLFAAIFLETGVVVLPILPGDSLLLAAGVFSSVSGNKLNLAVLIPLMAVASAAGDQSNYFIGRFFGGRIMGGAKRREGLLKKLEKARSVLVRFGRGAMFFSHFIPVCRSFIPFLCGLSEVSWKRFALFNAPGDCLWSITLLSVGYTCAKIPFVRDHLGLVALLAVLAMVASFLFSFLRSKKRSKTAKTEDL